MMNKSRIAKVKGKLYDIHTNNKSFLKVAKDLQTVGINNALFMLEIKDPSVLSIDPYQCDKDGHTTLSRDQISRVMTECARNPWYFLREIVRIPDQGGTTVPYRANRGNIAQAFCIWKGYDSWLCLPRQQGKTISAIAFLAWAYIFGTTNSTFIFLNKDGDNSKLNLQRLRDIVDLLPEYMRCDSIMSDEGVVTKAKKNATTLKNPVNSNTVVTKAKATSYDSALSIARGMTAPIMFSDSKTI